MSRAYAFIHFEDGTTFAGCYYGTSDVLYREMITLDDLKNKWDNDIFRWADEQESKGPYDLDKITDPEPCEIYVDYGYGMMWYNCKASRSAMLITSKVILDYTDNELDIDHYNISRWVLEIFNKCGYDASYFIDRIKGE